MSKYILKQSFKTRVLNFFRRFLTNPGAEKIIIKKLNTESPKRVWVKMVPPNYLYPPKSIRKISRNNIHYTLDISNVVDHFIYFGFKERAFEPVLNDLKKAEVIFDIGANIGSTAMYFSSINPTARIFAFEPHPHTFQRAMDNLQINSFKNISIYKTGFGNKPDSVKLYEVNTKNPGMNRIIPGNNHFPFVTIDIDTVDNFAEKHNTGKIAFIKIDVEGFEFNVLSGAQKILREQRPVLFIELDDDNLRDNSSSASELIKLLVSCGYSSFCRADTNTSVTPLTDFSSCHYDIIVKP